MIRALILSLLLLACACADQIRIDHREGTTGNYAPIPLTTTPGYVVTFDANGNPIIGPAAAGNGGGATLGANTFTGAQTINVPSGFVGNLLNAQVNGTSVFSVSPSKLLMKKSTALNGQPVFEVQNLNGTVLFQVTDTGVMYSDVGLVNLGGAVAFNYQGAGEISARDTGAIGFSPNAAYNAQDAVITRAGPANLRIGKAASATPIGQTLTIGEAGAGDNIQGANGFIRSGAGTGSGEASRLFFQTPTPTGAGSAAQTYANRLEISYYGIQAYTGIIAPTVSAQDYTLGFNGQLYAPSTGVIRLSNTAGTDFNRLAFGGIDNTFPAIKRVGTELHFRRADDSAGCGIVASTLITAWTAGTIIYVGTSGQATLKGPEDGVLTLLNPAENNFNRLQFGGTTPAAPAIKRSGASLAIRLADDSADAAITAAAGTFSGPVRLPQMTKAARNGLTAVNGMMVYQTDATPGMRVYENGAWVRYTATADP
ncbi:MAG TPA: hypothetical protein VFQ26_04890 [Nitrospiraceae bacterium]|nr:hypothetical protein [Nitrospiraceae bacterium]